MGRIRRDGEKVIVEFDLGEVIETKALIRLPDKNLLGFDYIGNFISRAAYDILKQKAPHLISRFNDTNVSGKGKVIVTFSFVEEQDEEPNVL